MSISESSIGHDLLIPGSNPIRDGPDIGDGEGKNRRERANDVRPGGAMLLLSLDDEKNLELSLLDHVLEPPQSNLAKVGRDGSVGFLVRSIVLALWVVEVIGVDGLVRGRLGFGSGVRKGSV